MSKHTPGPWYVSRKNQLRVIESGPRALTLATASTSWRGVTADGSKQEAEANARLIASAPDLLEALQRLSAQSERLRPLGYPMSDCERAAIAAISKATGEAV